MSRYNRHHRLGFLYILLLSTVSFSGSSLASPSKPVNNSFKSKLNLTPGLTQTPTSANIIDSGVASRHSINPAKISLDEVREEINSKIILADLSLNTFTGKNIEDYDVGESKSSIVKTVRTTALFLFLLFFLPLGLFYPFFLFYKRLFELNRNNQKDTLVEKDLESEFIAETNLRDHPLESNSQELVNAVDLKVVPKSDQVTFSQLQIAFYPESSNFRQQLKVIDSNQDLDRVEKMHLTISLLITQQDWTHADCRFSTLPVEKARTKFEDVLFVEQDKQMNRKLSLVNGRKSKLPNNYASGNKYKYTVVTMLFCFANDYELAENVATKKDLAEQLIKLSLIEQEDVVKFELLWNPSEEGEYLSNEELLSNYQNLTRLF